MSKHEERAFPARFDSLSAIDRFVASAAEGAGFDRCTVYQVRLAVDEACSNIIEHAYGGESGGVIECSLGVSSGELTIVLRDYGDPFDPESVPEPDVNASLQDRPGGGLGLYFIHHMMDEVDFEFDRVEGNVLTMVKRSESPGGDEGGDRCRQT